MKLLISYSNKPDVEVYILPNKEGSFQFVNITKGHICKCKFASIEDAVADLKNYPEITSWKKI